MLCGVQVGPRDYDCPVGKCKWTQAWSSTQTCTSLGESDPKLYINLDFVKEQTINIWKTHWSTSQAIYTAKKKIKRNLHILEDDASSVQVGILNT